MGRPVKGTGRRGTGRSARARETRRRIVTAAGELFVAQGYVPTTLEEVAQRAGVAVQTIYFHFGNKRTVLKEVVDVAAVGDDEPVAVLDRPQVRAAADEATPAAVIAAWCEVGRTIYERVAPIMRVVRDTAAVDPDMAEQWRVNEEQRKTAFRVCAGRLAELGALRPGLDLDDAVDMIEALHGLDTYHLLTSRGWPPRRVQAWAGEMLCAALLADPPPRSSPDAGQSSAW
ncbi:TetR/AcrR family transcriptional regulator [Pseudonocardia sp. N23]|uniref:TetR/AcrR family transcriptional regulator n=1 Tax=Pseudonocardia sp. N23 TaxID=1987376 RepID=UPI000BFDBE3E|nr:TetR/AcrR family transcriptional regulator [Pseudonocardia sp. N23]GAY07199.1 transcriptional regulator, tetr family [Pseudonocardia sp. N23]